MKREYRVVIRVGRLFVLREFISGEFDNHGFPVLQQARQIIIRFANNLKIYLRSIRRFWHETDV